MRNLIQQRYGLCWACDPSCCACQPCFEVVRSSTQKLISYMQRLATVNATKVTLTRSDAPGFVANVYKDL